MITVCLHAFFFYIDLAEITYRFTNCGSTNHDGPRVIQQCQPLYAQMNSPIANPGTLFQFEDFDGEYDGAQGFHVPRDDVYNVTIAGASGGEGVCNYHYGLGGVISAQVRLTTDYEYLILVGHKGTSVCDDQEANARYPVCQQPRPTNLEEAQVCGNAWFNYTNKSSISQNLYMFSGGGGGGGASMVFPRRVTDQNFLDLPIAISPGGGGASAILDYDFLAEAIPENFSNPRQNSSKVERYTVHVNRHSDQYYQLWPIGTRGARLDTLTPFSSGAGGGLEAAPTTLIQALAVDGRLLTQDRNFAQGGFGCSLFDLSDDFITVFGGYGGGGGGCGSGGGGGGYTGGHVISSDRRIPGSGGDSEFFNYTDLPVREILPHDPFNDGDGFVEIVASNCGCDGECVVYTDERQFECLCPNDTLLAEDGSSCYRGRVVRSSVPGLKGEKKLSY